jgi:hypothetical protein
MVFTRKFSQFPFGTLTESVGLAGAVNTRGPGGGGGASVTYTFDQPTPVVPALYLGAAVRVDVVSQLWETTLATTPQDAEFYAFIVGITGTTYTVQFAGPVPPGTPFLTGLIPGTPYYLSDSVAGGISAVPPAVLGEVNLPVLWAMDNGNSVIKMSRGFVEGSGGGGGGGGGTTPNNVVNIHQVTPFALGDVLYIASDQTFAKANGYSTLAAAQAEWMVTAIINPGTDYTIQQGGQVKGLVTTDDTGAPIDSGPLYYVSITPTQEGKLTKVRPVGPGKFRKPFYFQQVLSSNTGWLLDQVAEPANDSPLVFLGTLNNASPNGPYADANIFINNGGPFKSYLMIFNVNRGSGGHGLSATGPNPISIGFQFAAGGVFYTGNGYQSQVYGISNRAGLNTATFFGYDEDTSLAVNYATIFPNAAPELGTRVAINAASFTLIDNVPGSAMEIMGTDYCTDWSVGNVPSNHNYTLTVNAAGTNGGALGSPTSGIKLFFSGVGTAIFDGTGGYFSIWGIPNS